MHCRMNLETPKKKYKRPAENDNREKTKIFNLAPVISESISHSSACPQRTKIQRPPTSVDLEVFEIHSQIRLAGAVGPVVLGDVEVCRSGCVDADAHRFVFHAEEEIGYFPQLFPAQLAVFKVNPQRPADAFELDPQIGTVGLVGWKWSDGPIGPVCRGDHGCGVAGVVGEF